MFSIKNNKSEKLEKALSEQLESELQEPEINEDELFVLADYDASAAEKSGYSNYSYWQSTIRVFLKNKLAVFLLCVLVGLLLFTFLQPYLPGQYPANLINNHPESGKQLSNLSPNFSTVLMKAPAGAVFNATTVPEYEDWYAVDNVITSLQARTEFTIVEYGAEWCKIEYEGMMGYVKNNFQTKLKLPTNPKSVPYTSRSNFKLDMFTSGVASLANIGGTASAPILAGSYSGSLVSVGVLMALMGYVVGTFGGIGVGYLMSIFD